MFGQMCEFDASRLDWTQYSERLSHCFGANGITDAARKKTIPLTVVGTVKQLCSLVSPAKMDDSGGVTGPPQHKTIRDSPVV